MCSGRKIALVLGLGLINLIANAQVKNGNELPMVQIEDTIQAPLEGSYQFTIDSLYPHQVSLGTMDELLTSNSSIFFKSNGPGLLSTPSIRGGDAGSTNVLWNGIPVRSTMLGVIDFTTISTSDFTSTQITSGASSNLYGSGGNGGLIHLKSEPNFVKRQALVNLGVGSFGKRGFTAQVNLPLKIWKTPVSIRLNRSFMRNDNVFDYVNIAAEPYRSELNLDASYRSSNISALISAMLGEHMMLSFNYWNTMFDRSIPTSINLPEANALQGDTVTRYQIHYLWNMNNRLQLKQTIHFEQNTNHFKDSNLSINNSNQYYSLQSLSNLEYQFHRNAKLVAQYSSQWTEARSGNYNGFQNRWLNEGMLLLKSHWFKRRFSLDLGSRFIHWEPDFYTLPFASIGYSPWRSEALVIFSSGAITARVPTLNELYWNPGGNPDILPERGVNAEAGIRTELPWVELNLAGFYGTYEDRIRWLPAGGIFTPVNVAYSRVQGFDGRLHFHFQQEEWNLSSNLNVSYTESLGRENALSSEYTVAYVPKWNGNAAVHLAHKEVTVSYIHQLVSKRYITNDETTYMPSYDLAALRTFWNPTNSILTLGFVVNNLFDVDYQNIPWRPMPGRNYNVIIQLQWKD